MKLADRTVEIHSRGMDSNNQFTIAQTSKMFKILSDSLYSDKVMAVVRELSTNAYDAHVAAGNRQPFKVILPTMASPNFTVRDYGTGLSQEDMEELYTTYGASNKNDSNDFVGCLGLGSKSPFAYTKSFSTTSYHNGKAYNYIAAMDEAGVPSLSLFGITDTHEPNGLEISFAVKQYDFDEFSRKAMRVFHYFKMKPIIEGGTLSTLNDNSYSRHNYIIDGEGWRIGKITSNGGSFYPNEYNNIGTSIVAIMGNIAYPVDPAKVIGDKDKEQEVSDNIQRWNRTFKRADVDNWKNLVREIVSQGMYLEIQFDIGELEMDVSREGLQYTKNVINILQQKTSAIYLQLKADMSTKIAECDSLVDAYATYYKLSDLAGGWTAGADWTDPDGKIHTLNSGTDLQYKLAKRKQLYAINFRSATHRSRRMVYLTDRVHCETLQGRANHYWDRTTKSGSLTFFRCDTASAESAKKIVTKYCNQNDCMAYLMVDSDDHTESDKGFDQLIKDIGGEGKVLKVSDYRSLLRSGTSGKKRGSTGTISKDEVFIIRGSKDCTDDCKALSGNTLNCSSELRELSDDLADTLSNNPVLYVSITRYAVDDGQSNILFISKFMNKTDSPLYPLLKNHNVFAIKKSALSKLKKQGVKLVKFDTWFAKKIEKFSKDISKQIDGYHQVVDYCRSEINSSDGSKGYSWRSSSSVDKRVLTTLLSIYGLDYRSHINNKGLCDTMDNWMAMWFFGKMIPDGTGFRNFKKDDVNAHIATILAKYGMNGLDPDKIKKTYEQYTETVKALGNFTDTVSDALKISDKSIRERKYQLQDMTVIRKNLKAQVDNSPLLKYIVGMDDTNGGNVSEVDSTKPISTDAYYMSEWYKTVDADGLRRDLGKLI
jgi:hypothetical protein